MRILLATTVLCLFLGTTSDAASLLIHEWGTFTSLQDEQGHTIAGINTDDEPVPWFVHRLAVGFVDDGLSQGAPAAHPHVTMRLETPVVYLYPMASDESVPVDISVAFRGGWITEYYPKGELQAPGVQRNATSFDFGSLAADTTSTLTWRNLTFRGNGQIPETTEKVWLTPRNVRAAVVTMKHSDNEESEKYLFYRGVGHVESPLRVRQGEDGSFEIEAANGQLAGLTTHLWLVDVREDGRTAFVPLGVLASTEPSNLWRVPANRLQDEKNIAPTHQPLRAAMREALISAGLFADEADAMLDTWELSYFKSQGTRLFFMVSRAWTDQVLPMSAPSGAEVTRVMVGRIELVTAKHRTLLARITETPEPAIRDQQSAQYQAFTNLGRFRDAILLDELARRPNEAMRRFADASRIRYSTITPAPRRR